MMGLAAVETQEDNISHIWREIADGVTLVRTATEALIDP